jgi:hypothetical protein
VNDRQVIDAEREQVLQRFFGLPRRDQLAVYDVIREFLAVGVAPPTEKDARISQQQAALDAIASVAGHLGLKPGKAPTSVEFDTAARKVAPEWSSSRVIRAFGRWRVACAVYERGPTRLFVTQTELQATSSGRTRRYEGYWTSLRLWLKTIPSAKTTNFYDAFAADYNDDLKPGERPLPCARSITVGLNLDWRDAVRVADGEIDLEDAAPRERRDIVELPNMEGEFGLVGAKDAAKICGLTGKWGHERLIYKPGFPPPAVVLTHLRLWRREDIEAYAAGERDFSHRTANELRPLVMTLAEVSEMLGLHSHNVPGLTGLPAPVAVCGRQRLYLRDELEAAHKELHAVVMRRRKYAPKALRPA